MSTTTPTYLRGLNRLNIPSRSTTLPAVYEYTAGPHPQVPHHQHVYVLVVEGLGTRAGIREHGEKLAGFNNQEDQGKCQIHAPCKPSMTRWLQASSHSVRVIVFLSGARIVTETHTRI